MSCIERLDAQDWEPALSKLGYGPISFFRTANWIQTISDVYGLRTFYLVCRSKTTDKIVTMLPLVEIKSRVFGHRLISTPFCEYGGIAFDPQSSYAECDDAITQIWAEAERIADELGARSVEYRTGDRNTLPAGIRASPANYVTFNVTGDVTEVWKKFDRKLRAQIQSSQRPPKDIDTVYAIRAHTLQFDNFYLQYSELQSRRGSPMHSKKFFEEILKFDSVTLLAAQVRPYFRNASYVIVIEYEGLMNWWMNVNEPALRQFNGTATLLWKAMQDNAARNNGHVNFDMGRTRPGSGVYNYKKQWGGREEELVTVDSFGNTVLDVQPTDQKMVLASIVWKHLPLSLTRWIGPMVMKGLAL